MSHIRICLLSGAAVLALVSSQADTGGGDTHTHILRIGLNYRF